MADQKQPDPNAALKLTPEQKAALEQAQTPQAWAQRALEIGRYEKKR